MFFFFSILFVYSSNKRVPLPLISTRNRDDRTQTNRKKNRINDRVTPSFGVNFTRYIIIFNIEYIYISRPKWKKKINIQLIESSIFLSSFWLFVLFYWPIYKNNKSIAAAITRSWHRIIWLKTSHRKSYKIYALKFLFENGIERKKTEIAKNNSNWRF